MWKKLLSIKMKTDNKSAAWQSAAWQSAAWQSAAWQSAM